MKKSMRKLLISSLTLAMLLVNSLNVFAAETSEDQTTNVDVPLGVTCRVYSGRNSRGRFECDICNSKR